MSREDTQKDAPAKDLRLPGSVAEILASPPEPKIGAFFDLDGTLVAGFTAGILTQEQLRRRDMGMGELLSMVQAGLNHTLGRIEFEDLIGKASAALAGRLLTDLYEIGERLFTQRIRSRIYPEMRELVRAHVARGHTVVLSSSALTIPGQPGGTLPGHQQHPDQQVRDQRGRAAHRQGRETDSGGVQAKQLRYNGLRPSMISILRTATSTPTVTRTSR